MKIEEDKHLDSQNVVDQSILQSLSLVDYQSPFADLPKAPTYKSDLADDVIIVECTVGNVVKSIPVDLNTYYLPAHDAHSTPLLLTATPYRHFVDVLKGALNLGLIDNTDEKFANKMANNYVTFFTWCLDHGIFDLETDLTRDDCLQFLRDLCKGRHAALQIDAKLKDIISYGSMLKGEGRSTEEIIIRLGFVTPLTQFLKSDKYNPFRLSNEALSRRIGVHLGSKQIPAWFYNDIAELIDLPLNQPIGATEVEAISEVAVRDILERLNLMYRLPSGFKKPGFKLFPQTDAKFLIANGASAKGRTSNLPVMTAVSLMVNGGLWIMEYWPHVKRLAMACRAELERYWKADQTRKPVLTELIARNLKEMRQKGVNLETLLSGRFVNSTGEVINNAGKVVDNTGKIIVNSTDVLNAVKDVMAAALLTIYSNTPRRRDEIISPDYGLTYGCLRSNMNMHLMTVYIEKTLEGYADIQVNPLVAKAINVLQEIQEVFLPLGGDAANLPDDHILFSTRQGFGYDSYSPDADYSRFRYEQMIDWIKRTAPEPVHVRPHMWRRFYCILHWYRFEFPSLTALTASLWQDNDDSIFTYMTDGSNTEYADSIERAVAVSNANPNKNVGIKVRAVTMEVGDQKKIIVEEENTDLKKDWEEVQMEFMEDQIFKVLMGDDVSGEFTRVIAQLIRKSANKLRGVEVLSPEAMKPIAVRLKKEGRIPEPMAHGICWAIKDDIHTPIDAHCAKDGRIDRAQANSCTCGTCPNHMTNRNTLAFIEGELAYFESHAKDYSMPILQKRAVLQTERLKQMREHHISLFVANKQLAQELRNEIELKRRGSS